LRPTGYLAKLLAPLAERFAVSGQRVVVLPTELVSRNGDALKTMVVG
jgi:mannitol-1-phosphate/altronate dehydrogenase